MPNNCYLILMGINFSVGASKLIFFLVFDLIIAFIGKLIIKIKGDYTIINELIELSSPLPH